MVEEIKVKGALKKFSDLMKKQVEGVLEKDVKLVGIELYFLDKKDEICSTAGLFSKGFKKEDYLGGDD